MGHNASGNADLAHSSAPTADSEDIVPVAGKMASLVEFGQSKGWGMYLLSILMWRSTVCMDHSKYLQHCSTYICVKLLVIVSLKTLT